TIVSWSNNQIVATVSPNASTGVVTVTVSGVTSNLDNVFTVPAPQVMSISPASGPVGTLVTITGSNFQSAMPPSGAVYFNNVSASITSWNSTQIVATVPSRAVTGPVTVSTNSGVSSLLSNENVVFSMPNPVVTSVSPTSGPGGTAVQINGSGFGATQ